MESVTLLVHVIPASLADPCWPPSAAHSSPQHSLHHQGRAVRKDRNIDSRGTSLSFLLLIDFASSAALHLPCWKSISSLNNKNVDRGSCNSEDASSKHLSKVNGPVFFFARSTGRLRCYRNRQWEWYLDSTSENTFRVVAYCSASWLT